MHKNNDKKVYKDNNYLHFDEIFILDYLRFYIFVNLIYILLLTIIIFICYNIIKYFCKMFNILNI